MNRPSRDPVSSVGDPSAKRTDEADGDGRAIGDGIRRERLRRGLTLGQLAGAARLTPSAVSQIERGVTNPSLSSLRRIAGVLGVPMFQFLLDSGASKLIVPRSERIRLTFPGREITYELVTSPAQGAFEILAMKIAPGGASSAVAAGHAAEECTIVLSGRLRAHMGDMIWEMGAGDSVTIPSELPHRFENPGVEEAEALTVISPPTF